MDKIAICPIELQSIDSLFPHLSDIVDKLHSPIGTILDCSAKLA